MPPSREYRQQANECLARAAEAEELCTIAALIELAADFNEIADRLESRARP
jgi:hypothetical protein